MMNNGMQKQDARSWMSATLIPLGVTLLVLLVGSLAFWYSAPMDEAQKHHRAGQARYVTMDELEQQYGIRVTLIAVTAAGGMVDFRFRVMDTAKATAAFDDHMKMPVLKVMDKDVELKMPGENGHSFSFKQGKVYYMLFGNPGGVVHTGTPITVAMGDIQLEPIEAR